MRERRLKWFGHVHRADAVAKLAMNTEAPGQRPRGRPKLRWHDTLRRDMEIAGLYHELAHERFIWRAKAHKADPTSGKRYMKKYS